MGLWALIYPRLYLVYLTQFTLKLFTVPKLDSLKCMELTSLK